MKASSEKRSLQLLLPNRHPEAGVMLALALFQIALALGIWSALGRGPLPSPVEIAQALGELWTVHGLGPELWTSFTTSLKALLFATLISLSVSYLTVIPFFRPIASGLSRIRFMSLFGWTFIFTLMLGGGHDLKIALLTLGIGSFFLTGMVAAVAEISRSRFDYARTLRMSEGRVVWEVVVLGTLPTALELLRQNAAIGWMMLTMVEGLVRSEGGVGVLLLNQAKHFHLAHVFAIQFVVLLAGMVQDTLLLLLRRFICPWSELTRERK